MTWIQLATPSIAFSLTACLLLWMVRRPPTWLPLDVPNARSLHTRPTPRAGGLALLGGALTALALAGVADPGWLLPALALALVSWLDDVHNLPVRLRLVAQLAAAVIFLLVEASNIDLWLRLLALLATVWMTNLYNFMDGADGLAGGMTLFGFGFYGAAALFAGDTAFALANLILAGAALGFLLFNFYPARVFMGDVGSIPLGFLAAALGFLGWQRGLWPAFFPILVFSPFILDASITLLRRVLSGEKVWQAHKHHYYQRLVRLGWGHRNTALSEYSLMIACGASGLYMLGSEHIWPVTVVWMAIYLVLMGGIDHIWRRRDGKVT